MATWIVQNLEKLSSAVVSSGKLKTFGPENERIAFAFTYNKKLRWLKEGPKVTKDIFGVVVYGDKRMTVWNKRCARKTNEYVESENPLVWESLYTDEIGASDELRRLIDEFGRKEENMYSEENRRRAIGKYPSTPLFLAEQFLAQDRKTAIFRLIESKVEPRGASKSSTRGDLRKRTFIENIDSSIGAKQFTEALTSFYVGLKTGQGIID